MTNSQSISNIGLEQEVSISFYHMSFYKKLVSFLIFSCFFSSCYRVSDTIEPKVNPQIEASYLHSLSSPFPPLSYEEKNSDWGKEYRIGLDFAKQLDLYRAVSTFKRAAVLVDEEERALQIHYFICFCYYLGKKYEEVITHFEKSNLPHIDASFPAYQDLLVFLYESYVELNDIEKAECIFHLIQKKDPKKGEKLKVSSSLLHGNIYELEKLSKIPPYDSYLPPLLKSYHAQKKSVSKAQGLNALLPGAGYYYLGMKKTASTAFLLNGLFLYASYHFFKNGPLAAAIITTSFEMGWYFGGIYGAGEEAKFYNERLYEKQATPIMNKRKLFPVLMLEYGF